jgi:hypothetical protein
MKGTKEDDGDYQFNLALEQPYRKLLNQENYKQVKGYQYKSLKMAIEYKHMAYG